MSDSSDPIPFKSVEHFNESLIRIKKNAYDEFVKISTYFTEYVKNNGPDNFKTLMVVYNRSKDIAAIVISKPVDNKQELYAAMAQMLFLPASINSSLFMFAQDAKITVENKNNNELEPSKKIDALVVTYVTLNKCVVFTLPYTINTNNEVQYDFDAAFLSALATSKGTTNNISRGDMLELFFIFSTMESQGPFTYQEILTFLKHSGYEVQIIDHEALSSKGIGIPVKVQT